MFDKVINQKPHKFAETASINVERTKKLLINGQEVRIRKEFDIEEFGANTKEVIKTNLK